MPSSEEDSDHLNDRGGFRALLLPTDFDSAVGRLPLFCDAPIHRAHLTDGAPDRFERIDGVRRPPKRTSLGLSGRAPSASSRTTLDFHDFARPNTKAA